MTARSRPWRSVPTAGPSSPGAMDKSGAALGRRHASVPSASPCVHRGTVRAVAFSPDGKTVLTASDDGDGAALGRRHRQAHRLAALDIQARSDAVAFSPDGKDGPHRGPRRDGAAVGRRRPGNPSGDPCGIDCKVRAVAFSPDGRTVLTGSEDKTARLWDAVTSQPIGPTLVHQGPVVAVAFSPDGKSFLTASSDNTVRLWDADPGQPFGLILDHQDVGHVRGLQPRWQVDPQRDTGAARRRSGTRRPVRSSGRPCTIKAGSWPWPSAPTDRRLLTGSHDKTARLWDTATGKPIGPALQHEGLRQRGGIQSRRQDDHDWGRRSDGPALGRGDGDAPRPTHPPSRLGRCRGLQPRRQVLRHRLRHRLGPVVGRGDPDARRPAVPASRLHQCRGVQPGRQDPPDRLRGRRGAALGRGNPESPHGPAAASSMDLGRGLQP